MSSQYLMTSQANYLSVRRQGLDWRDRHMIKVDHHLHREIPVLLDAIEQKYNDISYTKLFFSSGSFEKEKIEPLFEEWVRRVAGLLLRSAKMEIDAILLNSQDFSLKAGQIECPGQETPIMETALTAASLSAGIGVATATSALSIGSVGGVMGLLGVTAVSWPIAIAGLGVSATLLAYGTYKGSSLKEHAIKKHLRRIEDYAKGRILCAPGKTENICWRLQDLIRTTAKDVLQELGQ